MCCFERQRKLWTDSLICIRSKLQVRSFHCFLKLSWSQGCPLGKRIGETFTSGPCLQILRCLRIKIINRELKLEVGIYVYLSVKLEKKARSQRSRSFCFRIPVSGVSSGQDRRLSEHCCVCIESWRTLVCSEGSQGKPASGVSAFTVSSV